MVVRARHATHDLPWLVYTARFRMAHAFSRVSLAPASYFKSQISNFKLNNRRPLGTRLNQPMRSARCHKVCRIVLHVVFDWSDSCAYVSIRGKTLTAAQVRPETLRI